MATVCSGDTTDSSPSLTHLISSYAILPTLASYISTVDLYHLALTDRTHFSHILGSPKIFKTLGRQCLCDGRGLADRQAFRGLYAIPDKAYIFSHGRHEGRMIYRDEPIEVQLYNLKCVETDILPCVSCGINVCEECRYYPRYPSADEFPEHRPFFNQNYSIRRLMGLCPPCDATMEKELTGNFLHEICDCDVYKRWVCTRCESEEERFEKDYFKRHTLPYAEWNRFPDNDPSTLTLGAPPTARAVWCPCGAAVAIRNVTRCTLCRRRHLPQEKWDQEITGLDYRMAWVASNPNYPYWGWFDEYPIPYPELGNSHLEYA